MGDLSNERIEREARDAVGAQRPTTRREPCSGGDASLPWRGCIPCAGQGARRERQTRRQTPAQGLNPSAGPEDDILPSHGLDILGRGLEQLVGQVPQGPGDCNLIPDLGDRGLPVS
jgi:hypothetical protein